VFVKYWEIIADNLKQAGWNWGCVSALDSEGRTILIADTHREDVNHFVVCADEKLTAFLELGRGCLYPPIERTLLTIIAALAASVTVVRADGKLTAFVALECAIRACSRTCRALRSA
jgi:hypothetical protein